MKRRLLDLIRSLTAFSEREGRRMLLLVPLLVALTLLFLWFGRPRFERSFARCADRAADSQVRARQDSAERDAGGFAVRAVAALPDSLFPFDPNTASEADFVRLGFTPRQTRGILRYRGAGAVFRRAEDFARCYTVSPEQFRRIEPYIRIASLPSKNRTDSPAGKRTAASAPGRTAETARDGRVPSFSRTEENGARDPGERFADSLFAFDPNTASEADFVRLGFTSRQTRGILRYREAGAVFRRAEDFARCYTVSPGQFRRIEPFIRIDSVPRPPAPVELNGADSAALVALHGIGPLTAGRIVGYRRSLGGYVSAVQLREVEGMTDKNYRSILQQICVDSSKIRKIDINFALPIRMKGHPYLNDKLLNRILKYRQLKGGWRSIGDLTEQHILTAEQAERLAPYLRFTTK